MIYDYLNINSTMMISYSAISLDTIDIFISECNTPLLPSRDIVNIHDLYKSDPSYFLVNDTKFMY